MIDECSALGISCGVYTSYYNWQEIVGLSYTYPADKGLPLWYAYWDDVQSFDGKYQFGGWTYANMKQIAGDRSSCGEDLDYDWYPSNGARIELAPKPTEKKPSTFNQLKSFAKRFL